MKLQHDVVGVFLINENILCVLIDASNFTVKSQKINLVLWMKKMYNWYL